MIELPLTHPDPESPVFIPIDALPREREMVALPREYCTGVFEATICLGAFPRDNMISFYSYLQNRNWHIVAAGAAFLGINDTERIQLRPPGPKGRNPSWRLTFHREELRTLLPPQIERMQILGPLCAAYVNLLKWRNADAYQLFALLDATAVSDPHLLIHSQHFAGMADAQSSIRFGPIENNYQAQFDFHSQHTGYLASLYNSNNHYGSIKTRRQSNPAWTVLGEEAQSVLRRIEPYLHIKRPLARMVIEAQNCAHLPRRAADFARAASYLQNIESWK